MQKEKSPKVSVIIPVYNGAKYIGETIESVLAQTYGNYDIIVVDDGSTDNTVEVVKSFGNQIVLLEKQNSGVGAARNKGAEFSDAEYYAFLDADDLWLPDKLKLQMEVFEKHPEVIVVGGGVIPIDANKKILIDYSHPVLYPNRVKNMHQHLLLEGTIVGLGPSICIIKKEPYWEIGGYRENTKLLSLDYDLWIHISKLGPFYILDIPVMKYRILSNSMIHGDVGKEYNAQMKILELNKEYYNTDQYNRRKAIIYYHWAETMVHNNSKGALKPLFRSLKLNPWVFNKYLIFFKYLLKRLLFIKER